MLRDRLDALVTNGSIRSWEIVNVSEDGCVGVKSRFRNAERLILTFPTGEVLSLETFCSGSAEDTYFI